MSKVLDKDKDKDKDNKITKSKISDKAESKRNSIIIALSNML